MTNKELADLIFPNITKTPEDYELMYPERNLKEGAKVVRFARFEKGKGLKKREENFAEEVAKQING